MVLSQGMVLRQYRIGRKLGSGGMGEVYQATDLVLEREVALKTLRQDAVNEHFKSLVDEARATSALDHPNIVKVYDVADVDGTAYIAMEYVEGHTLSQILSQRALRPKEAINYAIQIANALSVAHDMGILHRDVKPGNIMITRKNVIKMVDFGLAIGFDPPAPRRSHDAPTESLDSGQPRDKLRQFVGTVGYMSPEQILGECVDARSDIFSFGIVLYELLTRKRPFDAPSDVGIIDKILHTDPSLTREIVPDVPEELDDLVRFCLRKDPDDRARSMHDIAHMLEAARQAMDRKSAASEPGNIRRRGLIAGAAVLALIVAGASGIFLMSRGRPIEPRATLRRITWDDGLAEKPTLSNDGKFLAFASDRSGEKNLQIFLRHVSGGEPVRLTNDSVDNTDPSFSPDGSLIAFRSERQGGGVYVMPSFGGQQRLVAPRGHNPRFSPDGKWIVYWIGEVTNTDPSARTYIVPATGGDSLQLQPSFADVRYPIWTPDGAHILFQGVDVWRTGGEASPDWWVAPVAEGKDTGKAVKTGALDSIKRSGLPTIYAPGGWYRDKVVFSARDDSARFLLAIPLSARTWQVHGPPEALTFGTGVEGYPSPSPSGAIAFTSYKNEINIWSRSIDESGWVKGKEPRKLTTGQAYKTNGSMNIDGTRLVFVLGHRPGTNVWIRDLVSGREASLTIDAKDKCSTAISPDGIRVVWSVCGPGPETMFMATINPDLSASIPEKVCDDCGRVVDWSRAGDSILFVDHSNPVRIGILTLSSGARTMIASYGHNLNRPRFSPDGNWITLTTTKARSDHTQVFAIPMKDGSPGPESSWVPITNGNFWDYNPVWTERGDALLFYSSRDGFGCIWRQSVNRMTKQPEGEPTEVMEFHSGRVSIKELNAPLPFLFLIGNQILFNALERTGSIWVLDDGARGNAKN